MRWLRPFLFAVFFGSGASALLYQALWQRLLSLHAGMDLFSVTVVVAAFMAGLGLGNLAGGALADRLSPRGAVVAYGLAELVIGLFGLASPTLLYAWYPALSPHLESTAAAFAFHFGLLCLPTFLMGSTLPLLSRALVRDASIAPDVGRLYGVNTVGAAAGAVATAGPWLLSHTGLEPLVFGAAALNAVAGCAALALAPRLAPAPDAPRAAVSGPGAAALPWAWLAAYGLTGFIALGLEVVWFRLLNVVMSSNTYTFSRLLAVYLVGLGLGSVLGARLLRRVRSPERTFLWLQLATGLSALSGPVAVTRAIEAFGYPAWIPLRNVWIPLATLLLPTLLMGVSFAVIQAVVSKRLEQVGRSTGALLFANTLGCVAGTLVTGFALLAHLGTPATLRLFAGASVAIGLTPALAGRRLRVAAPVLALTAALMLALPDANRFWQLLHGAQGQPFVSREDHSCVTALVERSPGAHTLFISGEIQNGVPFDDFHVRLGWVPPLFHPAPKKVLVIGFGAGSTPYGLAADPRVAQVDTVEICGSEYPLVRALEDRFEQVRVLFADPRVRFLVRDGRKFLVDTSERYDVIITDTLLVRSSHSGSLYSTEFYELVKSRLAPGGLLAQWAPTERTLRSAAAVFPHVARIGGPQIAPADSFFLAGDQPVSVDAPTLAQRLAATRRAGLPDAQWAELTRFVDGAFAEPAPPPRPGDDVNRDLFPRDEYGHW
ncbi:MAG: fused MFS/spermidine synthase [Myxococcaceae bacterium]|nr:fused MFS/spermidine synthase [Myxococcaceae bacterium]